MLRKFVFLLALCIASNSYADSGLGGRGGLGTPPSGIMEEGDKSSNPFTKLIFADGEVTMNSTHAHVTIKPNDALDAAYRSPLSDYVPYSGATGSVNLGSYDLTCNTLNYTTLNPPVSGGGAAGNAAGSDTQVQYNYSDSFGANASLTYNATNSILTVQGDVSSQTVTAPVALIDDLTFQAATGSSLQATLVRGIDSIISSGESHSNFDTTSSGSIISAGTVTGSVLDISGDAKIDGYILPRDKGATQQVLTYRAGDYSEWQTLRASDSVIETNTPAYSTVQDMINARSSGRIDGGILTAGAGNTINISAGRGFIKKTNEPNGQGIFIDFPATSGYPLTLLSTNYIYVDYNSGTPIVTGTIVRTDINKNSQFVLGAAFTDGVETPHEVTTGMNASNWETDEHSRIVEVSRVQRASGLVVSSPNPRYLSSTTGIMYVAGIRQTPSAKDTSGADTFVALYRSATAGVFSRIYTQTQLSNTQYDDGSGTLASLGTNKYGVHWIYILYDGDLYSVFGQSQYNNLADAQAATLPASMPNETTDFGILAAKVIVQQGVANAVQVISAYTNAIGTAVATTHNDLGGLQGGSANEYYHLTASEFAGDFGSKTLYGTGVNSTGSVLATDRVNAGGEVHAGSDLTASGNVLVAGTVTAPVVAVSDSASIPRLYNLTSAGFVKSNSIGTLSVDTNTYLTSINLSQTPDVFYDRVPYSGATDSVALAGYNLQAKTIWASDQVLSVGEIHSTFDLTASGSILVAGTATPAVLDVAEAEIGGTIFPRSTGASGEVLVTQTGNIAIWTPMTAGSSSSGYNTVQDEGSPLTQRTTINFTGNGVTASDSGGVTTVDIPAAANAAASGTVNFIFDGGGSAISTDAIAWVRMPYSATLTEWDITAYSTSPTLVVDIWKTKYGDFQPEIGYLSIAGTEKPTLTNQMKNTDDNLSTWTTSIVNGNYIYARVSGVDTATYAVVTLSYTK